MLPAQRRARAGTGAVALICAQLRPARKAVAPPYDAQMIEYVWRGAFESAEVETLHAECFDRQPGEWEWVNEKGQIENDLQYDPPASPRRARSSPTVREDEENDDAASRSRGRT